MPPGWLISSWSPCSKGRKLCLTGELLREVQDVVVCEPCVGLRQALGDTGGGRLSRQGPAVCRGRSLALS